MNFRRMLASALARRVAYVIVAAALAWLGLGEARAQNACLTTADACDQGQAYQVCISHATAVVAMDPAQRRDPICTSSGGTSGYYYGAYQRCVGPSPSNCTWETGHTGGAGLAQYVSSCASRANYTGSAPYSTQSGFPVQGAMSCKDGCVTAWYNNGDGTWTGDATSNICTPDWLKENCAAAGTGYFWNAYAGLCQPPKESCESNQTQDAVTGECKDSCPTGMVMDATGVCSTEQDDCPAGNVKAPSGECLPGDGQCAAGEARRENGTCGKDSDGDGEADEDDDDPENDPEEESASGGDSCDSPPSCSGGAIDCMQVKIQWRIDCNTRKAANVSGGTCGAMPVCTGKSCDAVQYASLIQQWKAACALEKIASGNSGGDDGNAVVDLLTGPGSINSNAGGGDSLENGSPWGDEGEEFEPDASGYGYARSCPSPPSITLPGGQSVSIDLTPLCNWVALGGSLVLLLSGLMSLRIVAGGSA